MQIDAVALDDGVAAWFTGREPGAAEPAVGRAGNLSHRRPHRPDDLAANRAAVGARTATDPMAWHMMQQVHGRSVGVVTDTTPRGAELREVDAVVTCESDRPLAVFTADCVPVLLASSNVVAAAHAGRLGTVAGVVPATIDVMRRLGTQTTRLTAVIGPAIRGCCYEVPAEMREHVTALAPDAGAHTTWGSPSLDLPAAIRAQLAQAGIADVRDLGACTRCDPRWFSHRRDADAGRQMALIVRRSTRPRPMAADTAQERP